MSIVGFSPKGYLTGRDDQPFYLVGVNYVSSYVCTNFWEEFRPEHIEEDIRAIAAMGLNCVRVPMPWYTMEPRPGVYNNEFVGRFRWFVELCRSHDLYVMPWFLVGVATQCYDYPYRNGLSFFGPEMTERAEELMRWFIPHFADEEQILCWDICDEPEFYGLCGPLPDQAPFDRRIMRRWARDVYRAIKSVDKTHLVTLGYGPIATDHNGIHIRDVAETLDCLVVTAYPNVTVEALDRFRNNLFLPYNIRMHNLGKPVFCCEAPGHTNAAYSEEVLSRYFRLSFYGGLLNRSVGFMPWVFTDFDPGIWHKKPLEEATFEPLFGVCTADRQVKPRGRELMAFARFAREQRLIDYAFAPSRAAVMIAPKYYEENDPVFHKTYTAYALGQTAIGNLDLIWPDIAFSPYGLIVVPSTRGLTTSHWDKLRRHVESGGNLFVLYDDKRGMNAYLGEIFGFETHSPEKNYGYDGVRTEARFGSIPAGERLRVGRGAEVIRVNPRTCEVLMRFEDGSPAMVSNRLGAGRALLAMTDFNAGLLMDTPNEAFARCDSLRIFRAVAEETGSVSPFFADDLRVEAGYLDGEKNALLLCLNHHVEPVRTRVHLPGWAGEIEALSGEPVPTDGGALELMLEPAGVRAFRVMRKARP